MTPATPVNAVIVGFAMAFLTRPLPMSAHAATPVCCMYSSRASAPTAGTAARTLEHGMSRQTGAAIPLIVESVQWNESDKSISYSLRNDSTKVITAWRVAITYIDPRVSGNKGEGVDSYLSAAGLAGPDFHIPPGRSITRQLRLEGPASANAVVIRPSAVIFDDKTFVGDERFVEFVFERRLRDRDAWRDILHALETARSNTDTPHKALLRAQTELDSPLSRDRDQPVKRNARTNLRLAIADVESGRAQGETRLAQLIKEAQERLAAATAHAPTQ